MARRPAGGSAENLVAQPTALHALLYADSAASAEYWSDWDQVPADLAALQSRFGTLPVLAPGTRLGLFSFRYPTNNLPQRTLYLRRDGNRRLLVYNHGHGGLPAETGGLNCGA